MGLVGVGQVEHLELRNPSTSGRSVQAGRAISCAAEKPHLGIHGTAGQKVLLLRVEVQTSDGSGVDLVLEDQSF